MTRQMMRKSLVIFDWDGTLMDSEARIVNCFQSAARELGERLPSSEEVRRVVGLSLELAWPRLMPGLPESRLAALDQRYREHFLTQDATPMPYFPDVLDGLQRLVESGVWLAVATGKSRRGLDRALAEALPASAVSGRMAVMKDWFVATRCGDETFSKPHPQMLWDILEATGKEVSDAVMIGDTTFDMEMAKAAGMDRLGVSYGMHPKAHLQALANWGVVDDFSAVMDQLKAE